MLIANAKPLLRRGLSGAAGLVILFLLAACAGEIERVNTGSVSPATVSLMEAKDMERGAPILIRVFKADNVLEIWKQTRQGRYESLRSYAVCRYSGTLGPKKEEGDHQAPEGFYTIAPGQLNPHSREYLAFNIGYPNAYDRSLGRTGDSLMVHGGCRSVGCYAMTNEGVDEIYGLVYEAMAAGQRAVQFQAFPFRMTEENLQRHAADANLPFWSMLKQGSDLFEQTSLPPKVAACDRHYVFRRSGEPGEGDLCGDPGAASAGL